MNSALREQFESWAEVDGFKQCDFRLDDGEYSNDTLETAWRAYQAAHKAILSKTPTAWYVKATGAFHLNYERITPNEFLLGVTELREPA